MRRFDARVIGGSLLIGLGLLFLAQNMGWISFVGMDTLWGVIFLGAGLSFLYVFRQTREQWWAVIPGMSLVGLGTVLLLGSILPGLAIIGGGVFLGSVSAAFWLVYWTRRDFWWAIIPAGIVGTMAVIALLSEMLPGAEVTALMFLGIGATFLVLYLLPPERGHQPWAIIPAAILIILSAFTGLAFGTIGRFFFPAILIAGGIYLVYRASRGTKAPG